MEPKAALDRARGLGGYRRRPTSRCAGRRLRALARRCLRLGALRTRDLMRRLATLRGGCGWRQRHGTKDEVSSLLLEAEELVEHLRWHDGEPMCAHHSEPGG